VSVFRVGAGFVDRNRQLLFNRVRCQENFVFQVTTSYLENCWWAAVPRARRPSKLNAKHNVTKWEALSQGISWKIRIINPLSCNAQLLLGVIGLIKFADTFYTTCLSHKKWAIINLSERASWKQNPGMSNYIKICLYMADTSRNIWGIGCHNMTTFCSWKSYVFKLFATNFMQYMAKMTDLSFQLSFKEFFFWGGGAQWCKNPLIWKILLYRQIKLEKIFARKLYSEWTYVISTSSAEHDPIRIRVIETVSGNSFCQHVIILINILIKCRLLFNEVLLVILNQTCADIIASQPFNQLCRTDCIEYDCLEKMRGNFTYVSQSILDIVWITLRTELKFMQAEILTAPPNLTNVAYTKSRLYSQGDVLPDRGLHSST
jgi:hypothetical protein